MVDGCHRFVKEQFTGGKMNCKCIGAQTIQKWKDECVQKARDELYRNYTAQLLAGIEAARQEGLNEGKVACRFWRSMFVGAVAMAVIIGCLLGWVLACG